MTEPSSPIPRRSFLAAGAALLAGPPVQEERAQALISITLDLEMSRNFPTWEQTEWDYEKGNLNAATKKYAVEAARRVKEHGGRVHFFLVGRALEQQDVDWLKQLVAAGHSLGNHTYDHVNVLAEKPEDIQFRFRRAPWLLRGRKPREVIEDNIRLTTAAMKTRLGVAPAGFRTPGGFANGLNGRADIQRMLLDLGFSWVSSQYTAHPVGEPGKRPGAAVCDAIVAAQRRSQPYTYPTGLVEVPMSPISDITAFRAGRWPLDAFLKSIRMGVDWAIEHRSAFDFLGHPSCLYVVDPEFRALELICDLVHTAGKRAALVGLDALARRAARVP